MLILHRRVGDRILVTLGDTEIIVQVVEISSSGSIRIGIDAPPEVKILRAEKRRHDERTPGERA